VKKRVLEKNPMKIEKIVIVLSVSTQMQNTNPDNSDFPLHYTIVQATAPAAIEVRYPPAPWQLDSRIRRRYHVGTTTTMTMTPPSMIGRSCMIRNGFFTLDESHQAARQPIEA
jgi:hypothetical protein